MLFQMVVVAFALTAVAANARDVDAGQITRAVSGVLWVFFLLPLLIVLQLLPVPASLSHPIWTGMQLPRH